MSTFPRQLDGANVLWVAPAIPGRLGLDYETGLPVAVVQNAVAQYPGDEPRAYLFAVSADHSVVGDGLWESPEEAMRVAINSGLVKEKDWKPCASNKSLP
jgi:hypothetical protein